MTQLPEASVQEIQLYVYVVQFLLTIWAVILLCHLLYAVSDLVRRWRRGSQLDIELFNAGRDLEHWLQGSANRSASVRLRDDGEWLVTLRDPDCYMAGPTSLVLRTSMERPLALTVQAGLVQAHSTETAPPV